MGFGVWCVCRFSVWCLVSLESGVSMIWEECVDGRVHMRPLGPLELQGGVLQGLEFYEFGMLPLGLELRVARACTHANRHTV